MVDADLDRTGSLAALDAAIQAYQVYLSADSAQESDRYVYGLVRCARLHGRRVIETRVDHGDTEQAWTLLHLARTKVRGDRQVSVDVDLGMVARARYHSTKERDALDRAAETYRRVLNAENAHPEDVITAALLQAEVMLERHRRWPSEPDLHEAGAAADRAMAVDEIPIGAHARALGLSADVLVARASLQKPNADAGDLDRAIDYYSKALAHPICVPGSPLVNYLQENLAWAHELRFQSQRSIDDLDRAIDLLNELLQDDRAASPLV